MIAHARRKLELELSLPPFTDAASLALRQKLMEQQERREFELRESELDEQRQLKLQAVAAALQARNESAAFLAEQKLEALRQTRMDKRAMALEKIKAKRLKVREYNVDSLFYGSSYRTLCGNPAPRYCEVLCSNATRRSRSSTIL